MNEKYYIYLGVIDDHFWFVNVKGHQLILKTANAFICEEDPTLTYLKIFETYERYENGNFYLTDLKLCYAYYGIMELHDPPTSGSVVVQSKQSPDDIPTYIIIDTSYVKENKIPLNTPFIASARGAIILTTMPVFVELEL